MTGVQTCALPILTRNTPVSTIARLLGGVAAPDPAWICGRHRNDLEPVVRLRYPAVDEAVRWASNYGPAKMSGSGSCVFALLDDSLAESHQLNCQIHRQACLAHTPFAARDRKDSGSVDRAAHEIA